MALLSATVHTRRLSANGEASLAMKDNVALGVDDDLSSDCYDAGLIEKDRLITRV